MLGLTGYLILAIAGAIALFFWKSKKNLPPGPPAYPIIGNTFQLAEKPHLQLAEWAKEYGKMFTLRLGANTVVVVNDFKLAKDILFDSNFALRPSIPVFHIFSGGEYGILMTNGTQWEEQRRWSLRKLRDYGFGKTSMEGLIMDEVNEVVEYFQKNGEKPITIADRFNVAAMNAIWTLLTGERVSQEDPKIRTVLEEFQNLQPLIAKTGVMFSPLLRHVFPGAYKQLEDAADRVMGYAREAVRKHFDSHQEGSSRDFIDEYINEIKQTTNPSSSFYKELGRKNLEGTVSDLIQAGSETTSNTISWAICFLSHNPEIQKKLQEELSAVIGDRPVTLSDKPLLPYTDAVIQETLRHSSLASAGVVHSAANDQNVEGYTIPKDAWIFTNIYYIHHDPQIWGDPENFRPERFLSADGTKVIRNEHLIPFQLERRQCLGESLARDSLFLFIATIFQKFQISKVEKGEPEAKSALILIPQPYNFVFKPRTM